MSSIVIAGDTSGSVTLQAPAVSGSSVLSLPAVTDTVAGIAATQTLTNKTLTAPILTAPVLGTPASGVLTNATGINYDGFKNRIINGAMVIDQRNAGASVTPTDGQFSVDRWKCGLSQASKYSAQQSTTAPAGFINSIKITSLSAYSSIASDYFVIQQGVEGFNIADLAWGSASASAVTLSFKVYSSLTGTFGGALQNNAGNRSYPFTYTISSANTWTTISVTIAGDTSGTWLTTNSTGIFVYFNLGTGTTFSGTAGAWAGANYLSATGATSVVGTNGATFYITGVQLEKGSTATSFDFRSYGTELQLCQRYYEKSYNIDVVPATNTGVGISKCPVNIFDGVSYPGSVYFKVSKRTAPTMTFYRAGGTSGNWDFYQAPSTSAGVAISAVDTSTSLTNMTSSTSSYTFCQGHWVATSEL